MPCWRCSHKVALLDLGQAQRRRENGRLEIEAVVEHAHHNNTQDNHQKVQNIKVHLLGSNHAVVAINKLN